MSETRTAYLTHPDEIDTLQAAGADNTQREQAQREWAAGTTLPGNAAHTPMPAACSPLDVPHLRCEVEALRDLILGDMLVFTPGNVADCLDRILREINGVAA